MLVSGWFWETVIGIAGIAVMFLAVKIGNKKQGPLGHVITVFGVAVGVLFLVLALRIELLEKIMGIMGLMPSS